MPECGKSRPEEKVCLYNYIMFDSTLTISYILGITPLYDAASNGHLEVVNLLLEKGAIPTLKTDFGETPLQVLQKWRTSTILTKDEESLYNIICNKIHNMADRNNTEYLNRSKSKTPVKTIQDTSPPSTSKKTSRIKELYSPALKRRNIIDDESDEEFNLSQNVRNQTAFPSDSNSSDDERERERGKSKTLGVTEYKNAMSAIRNRNTEMPESEKKKTKPKPALLAPDEIDDDWLDDDMGIMNKTKKRKLSDPLTVIAKKTSINSLRDSIDNINKINPLTDNNSNKKKSRNDVSENSSDSDHFHINENIRPKNVDDFRNISRELNDSKAKDTRDNMRRRWKRQSTLLRAGFQRKKSVDSNSGSDTEFNREKKSTVSFSRKSSMENVFSNSNDGFNIVQSMNPNIVQPVNVIQPISIVQNKNGRAMQTQILPPAAVKVKIEDKVLLISLKLETINKLTISWLVEEVKSRYYK